MTALHPTDFKEVSMAERSIADREVCASCPAADCVIFSLTKAPGAETRARSKSRGGERRSRQSA